MLNLLCPGYSSPVLAAYVVSVIDWVESISKIWLNRITTEALIMLVTRDPGPDDIYTLVDRLTAEVVCIFIFNCIYVINLSGRNV
jgi:uncharacterized membrane protein (DUF2068 family)